MQLKSVVDDSGHWLRGQLWFYKSNTILDTNSDISQRRSTHSCPPTNSFWSIFLVFFLLSVSNQSHSNYELKINNYAWILRLLDEGIQLPQYPHNYQSEFPSFPSLAGEDQNPPHTRKNYLKYVGEVPVFWNVLSNRVFQENQQVSGTNLTCLKFWKEEDYLMNCPWTRWP